MGRGRKPEEKSIVAGARLKRAIKLFGKSSITALVEDQRWIDIVKIFDEKTIRTWIKNGIPLRRLSSVSQYFNVFRDIFSNELLRGLPRSSSLTLKKLNWLRQMEKTEKKAMPC